MERQRENRSLKHWFVSGEPWIWMNAAAVGISITAVVGLLLLIAVKGFAHFWPSDITRIEYKAGEQTLAVFGEIVERDSLSVEQFLESSGSASLIDENVDEVTRWLVKTGNRRITPPDFRWLFDEQIVKLSTPQGLATIERVEWGNAYGRPVALDMPGAPSVTGDAVWPALVAAVDNATDIRTEIVALERGRLGEINYAIERLRLERRGTPADAAVALADLSAREEALKQEYDGQEKRLRELHKALDGQVLTVETADSMLLKIELADLLHVWRPNDMSTGAKLGHYFNGIWRFLTEDPREANTEGGIFPAIFGTVMMVLLMSVLVTPFGVVAAVYLREYAKQGILVRLIRIAVNNLAGVPSIVYGVFGLGFFVYFLGGNIDRLFFTEALPAPTFGTPGLMWAALTLALLTVPVVIVSTEEGLTRIPRSLREGSLALGATKAETLFKVVLPMASPSILTGVILAVARAAGEVAPLMLVGVVKLAPTLPLDGNFPYLHLERKFMHLGFHIYDVGFQSPNVEAARPLVYATALLLVLLIIVLNLTAITLRSRLEQRYKGVES